MFASNWESRYTKARYPRLPRAFNFCSTLPLLNRSAFPGDAVIASKTSLESFLALYKHFFFLGVRESQQCLHYSQHD